MLLTEPWPCPIPSDSLLHHRPREYDLANINTFITKVNKRKIKLDHSQTTTPTKTISWTATLQGSNLFHISRMSIILTLDMYKLYKHTKLIN